MDQAARRRLTALFDSAVAAVKGEHAVSTAIAGLDLPRPDRVLALGKAAVAMYHGLPQHWQQDLPALIVTKTGHIGSARFGAATTAIEANHPMPCEDSLKAGRMAREFVAAAAPGEALLMLVSGGGSALVEDLLPGYSLTDLQALTRQALAEGANIGDINARRRRLSQVKGGRLLAGFGGARADVLLISDVQGDAVEVIASGIGAAPETPDFTYSSTIVASNAVARAAVAAEAAQQGIPIVESAEILYDDVTRVAAEVARRVQAGPAGLYVFGGEPTVVLPPDPGQGGRNQALALELARLVRGQQGITGLVAGTDGTDGPTEAAGGFFDGESFDRLPGGAEALAAANSGAHLAQIGELFVTGPTGTNVMDLALVLKAPD